MPKVPVYNQEGASVGDVSLPEAVFAVKVNPSLVHEVMVGLQANRRNAVAHTKTRGEVRGGGRKPWKQKGTGRARQGSIRSPQWIGGGIVFGPRGDRNFSVKINKKVKRQALFMALTDKVADKQLVVVDAIHAAAPKTKIMAAMLAKLPVGKTSLVVLPASRPEVVRMARNIPSVTVVTANSVGLLDVLSHRSIVFVKDAIPAFEKLTA